MCYSHSSSGGTSVPDDFDGDMICDKLDTDDDGDGVEDAVDAYPLDATRSVVGSGDGFNFDIDEKLFPNFRIARMDSDSMRRKDSYQKILDAFRLGKTDILIGTQMIAKGLDFPNVTLVGVLNADISIHVPDFRAGERTYQLLTQVAGRAGRGDIPGEVIIQTYNPKHPAIKAASKLDEDIYSINDLIFRKKMMYPPYSHLILVTLKLSLIHI